MKLSVVVWLILPSNLQSVVFSKTSPVSVMLNEQESGLVALITPKQEVDSTSPFSYDDSSMICFLFFLPNS